MSSSNYHKYKHSYGLVLAAVAVITALAKFIKAVTEKGRLVEFFITTPLLIAAYYYMSKTTLHPVIYLIPITAYFIYWSIILAVPKRMKFNSENHWSDESWWWSLDGWDFEEEVAKVFRKYGYKAKVTRKTRDGGADIVMYFKKKKIIVQCKHYKETASPETVRALWGVRDEFNADEVILVASSGVSQPSLNFIKRRRNYTLYTLQDIIRMATRASS